MLPVYRLVCAYLEKGYLKLLKKPLWLLMGLVFLLALAGTQFKYFSYDASSETLIAEDDPEFAYYNKVVEDFGGDAFVVLTYTPLNAPLFSRKTLLHLDALQQELASLEGVANVTSMLDVPLLQSPPIDVTKLVEDYKTLRDDDVDLSQAIVELTTSPVFKELLISVDGQTTALKVSLQKDQHYQKLWAERKALRTKKNLTNAEKIQKATVEDAYTLARKAYVVRHAALMEKIRQVRDTQTEARIFLSGVPMIASDMVRFIKKDVLVFGFVTLLLMMGALFAFFKQWRWVFLPLLTAGFAVLLTTGLLGLLRQPVTVISSNYTALLLIFSISFTVHLIVRYREFGAHDGQSLSHREKVYHTMTDKFAPCFYTALTTIAAFASFSTSKIVPVIDFGWIMCVGMLMALLANYTLFPVILLLLPEGKKQKVEQKQPLLAKVTGHLSVHRAPVVVVGVLVLSILSGFGLERLSTDSRFIEYFKKGTEIREGLTYIDKNMGGTIPMDIILKFPPYIPETEAFEDDFFAEEPDAYPERYWFTPDKIAKLHQMHTYLEAQPAIGKLLSLATLEKLARSFTGGEPLGSVEIAAILGAVPKEVHDAFIRPYGLPEKGIMRISARIHETAPPYDRSAFIEGIKKHAIEKLGFNAEDVRVTGMNVLFNDMLKTLVASQLSTIGFVVAATLFMFFVLLRSVSLALIGVLPNVLSAVFVLAIMGGFGMPLDMMTITIAAIIIGIGVDDAVHYLHRFKQERQKGQSVADAITQSHRHIGVALYVTSFTIVVGFSVLAFSNFIPTVFFGLLTALAMVMALLVNLLLLPSLIKIFLR